MYGEGERAHEGVSKHTYTREYGLAYYASPVEVRVQASEMESFPSLWDPGIEPRFSGLFGKRLYLLNHSSVLMQEKLASQLPIEAVTQVGMEAWPPLSPEPRSPCLCLRHSFPAV